MSDDIVSRVGQARDRFFVACGRDFGLDARMSSQASARFLEWVVDHDLLRDLSPQPPRIISASGRAVSIVEFADLRRKAVCEFLARQAAGAPREIGVMFAYAPGDPFIMTAGDVVGG